MAKRDTGVQARLDQYRRLCDTADAGAVTTATRDALAARHFLLVAKAAEACAERMLYELTPELTRAYARFLDNPAKSDPGCTAKGAIARALVALDYQDAPFYVAGIRYRQPEPVWGGSVDTAVDLRCSCASGLVATPYPRAVIELVGLLHDPEPHARSCAARAIACTEHLTAEALLRSKALAGDPEPSVIGDCLAGLLQVEPDEAPAFVAGFLDSAEPAIREQAALALGESRLDAALARLRQHWEGQPMKRESDRILLRAAVIHRSEAAFAWLCNLVERGDRASAETLIEELAVYKSNRRLAACLERAVRKRGDARLTGLYDRTWEEVPS